MKAASGRSCWLRDAAMPSPVVTRRRRSEPVESLKHSTVGERLLQSANRAGSWHSLGQMPQESRPMTISTAEGAVHPIPSGIADDVDCESIARGTRLSELNFETSADLERWPETEIESAPLAREELCGTRFPARTPKIASAPIVFGMKSAEGGGLFEVRKSRDWENWSCTFLSLRAH